MKTIKVGINGFGRIGRAFLKIAWERPEIEIVAVNDLGDVANLAYLLQYDTVYRKWNKTVTADGQNLMIDGKAVKVIAEKDPAKLPWKDLNIDVVVEKAFRILVKTLEINRLKVEETPKVQYKLVRFPSNTQINPKGNSFAQIDA